MVLYLSRRETATKVGVDYCEGPPVPIPNTEVKLACAEDTWLATTRDNRFSPTLPEKEMFRKLVLITVRVHLFPSRTQKLSSRVPKILGWQRPGTIGFRQHKADIQ